MDLFDLYFSKQKAVECSHLFIEDGMRYCQKCGQSEPIVVEKSITMRIGRLSSRSLTTYKATNHLKEKLLQLCAMENVVVSSEILELCKDCNDHERSHQIHVTKAQTKAILRARLFYFKTFRETCPLLGLDRPEIEKLVYLFNRFLEVYHKHKRLRNVINYHYLLSKLLPLINRCDIIPHLYKIRNPRKLKEHDKTVSLIFTELGWI